MCFWISTQRRMKRNENDLGSRLCAMFNHTFTFTLPSSFSMSPRIADARELLPLPTAPTTATNSSRLTRKFMLLYYTKINFELFLIIEVLLTPNVAIMIYDNVSFLCVLLHNHFPFWTPCKLSIFKNYWVCFRFCRKILKYIAF